MRRRSEVCAFRFEDLETRKDAQPILRLRKSKTDQEAVGEVIPISPLLASLIEFWSLKINTSSGYILRAVDRHGDVKSRLSPASIQIILNSIAHSSGSAGKRAEFSGHSFRVGAALDLLRNGATLEQIMVAGGWRSADAATNYLRSLRLAI
jgi:integrase